MDEKKSSKEDFMTCENSMELTFQLSVNKVSLARSPFMYAHLWLLSTLQEQIQGVARETLWLEKPETLSDPLQKKSTDPWLLSIDSLPSFC